MIMTHTNTKSHVQRSVGSKDRVKQTDGQTDKNDRITPPPNEVGNYLRKCISSLSL